MSEEIRPRKPNKEMIARNRKILLLYAKGWTLGRIGRRYGITRERVKQIIDAAPLSGGAS